METEVLKVNMPSESAMWLYLSESEISMEQSGVEIILDYLKKNSVTVYCCGRITD